jgi:hypothetical protein
MISIVIKHAAKYEPLYTNIIYSFDLVSVILSLYSRLILFKNLKFDFTIFHIHT